MATPEPDHFLATHQFPPGTTPQEILKIVWDRFYQWDEESCRGLLNDLRSKQRSRDGSSELENALGSFTPSAQPDGDADEFFDVVDYDENGDQLEEAGLLSVNTVEKEPTSPWNIDHWKPNPRYLACTPLSANIFVPHEGPTACSFPPFTDDHAFKLDSFLALYNRFSWQWDFKDPDYEMIHLETARILHFHPEFQLSFEEIDDLNLPSLPKLRKAPDSGLVWESYQRDPLFWTDYVVSLKHGDVLSLDFVAACYSNLVQSRDNVFLQVQHGSKMFCPNIWCLNSYLSTCNIHKVPEVRELKPTVPTTEFEQRREPCSNSCFRLMRDDAELDDDAFIYLHWQDAEDREMLRNVLKLAPDALPCDLAIICRKPCDQVFANRKSLFPDEDILDERCEDPPIRFPITQFADKKNELEKAWATKPPCSHPGPCRRHVCSCFDMNYHCERNCRCAKDCEASDLATHPALLAFAVKSGGKAADANEPRGQNGCPAAMTRNVRLSAHVELLRGSANLNSVLDATRGRVRVAVSRSQWGYGAFAASSIPKGAYVGDYVGEQENQADADPEILERIQKFLGLNYSFELFDNMTIDAKNAGNETRYLNHGSDDKANCVADVVNVHNTQRIILASNRKIRKGKELLLNYGENYWPAGGPEDDEDATMSDEV